MSAHNIPFSNTKQEITLNYPKSAAVGFFQGAQERVRNNRGKLAISARATKVLLYLGNLYVAVCCLTKYFDICLQMPLVHSMDVRKLRAKTQIRLRGYELSI